MELVYLVGMVVGAIMTGSVCYVLIQKKQLEYASLGFTALGVLLIGMSVWTQFRIQISADGAVIEALRNQVEQTAQAVDVVASELETAAGAIETNQAQFGELTTLLFNESGLPRAEFQRFTEPVEETPQIDRARLGAARADLGRVMRAEP